MFERKYKIEDNRIVKKSDGKPILDDEPVFIFRAQDRKAIAALMAYCSVLDSLDQRAAVMNCIEDFRRFQELNPERMKEPTP